MYKILLKKQNTLDFAYMIRSCRDQNPQHKNNPMIQVPYSFIYSKICIIDLWYFKIYTIQ